METITYNLPAKQKVHRAVQVGVVGSGDLEIIMEPNNNNETNVTIRTGINGFKQTWDALIHRFFEENDVAANVMINDFGATPGVVKIRLSQALEVSKYD